MHLCLSSGTTPRYREDVLRALAMPSGTDLQFRYRTKWLSPQTKAGLGEVRNDRAIIAYIDQSDVQKTPLIIPCRFARIVGAISHGTTVSVTLRVEGFALSSDLARTNASLRTLATGVPDWNNGRAAGYWWTDIANPPDAVEESYKLSAWESIVEQLYGHEFAHDDVFYTVVGICDADGGLQESDDPKTMPHFVAADDGRLVLNAEKDYEIRAYHYHPKSAPTNRMSFAVE